MLKQLSALVFATHLLTGCPSSDAPVTTSGPGSKPATSKTPALSASDVASVSKAMSCLRFDKDEIVVRDPATLARLARESKCPAAPSFDFSDAVLVGAYDSRGGCTFHKGWAVEGGAIVLEFSQWNTCVGTPQRAHWFRVQSGRATRVRRRQVAVGKVPGARVLLMNSFAQAVRALDIGQVRRQVAANGVRIKLQHLGEPPHPNDVDVVRKPAELTDDDLRKTYLYTRKIQSFKCREGRPPVDFTCLATGEGYMNAYHWKATDSSPLAVMTAIEESEH